MRSDSRDSQVTPSSTAGVPPPPASPPGDSGAAPAVVHRGNASIAKVVLAALRRRPARGMEQVVYHCIAAGKHLTIGGVTCWALWMITTHMVPAGEQTRAIVTAIRDGAAAQVESSEKVATKVEILADRLADQTTEVTRLQALAAGRYRCPTCPQCPDCRCQPCPDPPRPASTLKPSSPTRRETTR